ncbi:glycosyltransferase family 4 protein [Flavobacterium sp.]|uniref:glycosyltransferase family 4 protein n=1 Tax=Flavobacterium sp. TaxID=239 RepID=UPI003C361A47
MKKRKVLFLGETYRADAITWMKGLEDFGGFEIITWELKNPSNSRWNRFKRLLEYLTALIQINKIIRSEQPDMVIAERTTSYGFLAALSPVKIKAIAQQGRTDLWPENSILFPLKKIIQKYAFNKATLIHAWGPIMAKHMKNVNVNMSKVLVLPKGIDLSQFKNENTADTGKICAVVTRSLFPVYSHDTILKAFGILHQREIDFSLTIIGDGNQLDTLQKLSEALQIQHKVVFTGRIKNTDLPELLQKANIYIGMPKTEGVSGSLFEAMASNCYPIVSDIEGNQSWINHRRNGQLVPINDYKTLADFILWSFENESDRNQAVKNNRKFIEEHIDYKKNMSIIASKYHELIDANSSLKLLKKLTP